MKRHWSVYNNSLPPKNTPKKSTVLFAESHDENRMYLHGLHHSNFKEWASDGFRLHWLKSSETVCQTCKDNGTSHPDIEQAIPKSFRYIASFDAFELRSAIVKAASMIKKDGGAVKIEAGDILEVTPFRMKTSGLVVTESVVCETYDKTYPVSFGTYYKYAIDALDHCAPSGGKVYIKVNDRKSPVMFQGGFRYAVVMPMYLRQ